MSKMYYFSLVTNFQKSPSAGGSPPLAPHTVTFDDLKLRNLTKLCFFKLIAV